MAEPRRGSRLTPEYQFDSRLGGTGRYVEKSSGRIVSQAKVSEAMEAQITASRKVIGQTSTQLARGEISLAQWQTTMRDSMKTIHTQSAALAKGGWAQMSQADWGATGQISANQYHYLQRFAGQIESGKQQLLNVAGEPSGQFLQRADLYAQAGNSTYHKMNDRNAGQNGLTEEMRELDPQAKHCDCCLEQAGHWEPLGTLTEIGGCTCSQRCRCRKVYR